MGLLKFEDCILDEYKFGKFTNTDLNDIENACENLRYSISKGNNKYFNYPKDARWNLGIYNDDTPIITKQAFDIYIELKKIFYNKNLNKAIEDSNTIEIVDFNLRKEKINKLLNKKE